MPKLFDPAIMPGDNMSPELIEAAATNMGSVGTKVSTRGGTVLTRWQGISSVYDAPEDTTLTQAMNPVKTKAEAFGTDMAAAAKALDTFADQVRTIKAEVARIRADAASFLGGIKDGKVTVTYYGGGDYYTEPFDWHTDQDSIDANNVLVRRAHAQMEALMAAERACASAIRAAIGLGPVLAKDAGDPNGYGVTDIPDHAPMPWGGTVERTEDCLERAGEGVVDAGGAALSGLGNLVGISYSDDQGWDWALSTAGEAWLGVTMFTVGALTFGPGGLLLSHAAPGPVGKFLRDSQFMVPATVAGLVSIDLYAKDPLHKWKEDGGHASGETLFNLATLPLAALKVSNVAKLGRLGKATPDGPDTPSPRNLPDGRDATRGADPSDVTGLGQKADLDDMFSIRTDLDIPASRGDTDGPPTDRSDDNGRTSDRTDTDGRGSDSTPEDSRPDADAGDPDSADPGRGGSEDADGGSGPADRPEVGSGSGTPDDPRVYGYENPAEALRGSAKPDLDDVDGRSRDYTPGTAEHMEARWQEYLGDKTRKGKTPWEWERWRDRYIDNQGHLPRGTAFEQAYKVDHPEYAAGGYQFNTLVPDELGIKRNYDILSVKNAEAVELKSGSTVDPKQLAKDVQMRRAGYKVRYVFGQQPSAATIELLRSKKIDFEVFNSVPVLIE